MLFKQPEHRRFDYQPLFYKPEKDPEVQRKKRIHFPRYHRQKTVLNRIVIIMMLLLMALFYLVHWVFQRSQ